MKHLSRVALSALVLAPVATAQAKITWKVADIVDANTDVSTRGEPVIAVNFGPEVCEKVVNGVHFQADRSHWTRKILSRGAASTRGVMHYPTLTAGGFTLTAPYNRTAGNIGPRHTTEADYDAILKDGRHQPGGTLFCRVRIDGLTPGSTYEVQIFYGNKGRPNRVAEWDDGLGNRPGSGGILMTPQGPHFGQVATGTFVADSSGSQTFTNYQHPAEPNHNPPLPETFNALNALQIRDITAKVLTPRASYYGEGTPGTNTQPNLGGSNCSPMIALADHPKDGISTTLSVDNSSDVATSALIVLGAAPANLSFLGGTLLVNPLLTVPAPMPAPMTPYNHEHELQLPITISGLASVVYVQGLMLDANAPGGVAMTPGMKIEIGL